MKGQKNGEYQYPLEEISLELSNRCYAKCLHCSSSSSLQKMENELEPEEWIDLMYQAKILGASIVSFSGGDPLAYPFWQIMVEEAVSKGFEVLFYTCGIKGREPLDMIDCDDLLLLRWLFRRINKGKIIFSLEGASPKTHNAIVGIDCFHEVVSVIRAAALDFEMDVEVHFTPTSLNYQEIPQFLNLVYSIGVKKASFLRLVPQGRTIKNSYLNLSPKQFVDVQHMLYGYDGFVDFRVGCPLSFGHLFGYIEERPRCHAGFDLLLVRPNGEVHCCAACKNSKSLQVGNVRQQPLWDIWENSRMLNMVREYNKKDAAEGCCVGCPYFDHCGGGCPSQRVLYNQQNGVKEPWDLLVEGVDPQCPYFNDVMGCDVQEGRRQRTQDGKGNVGNTI